MTTPSRKAKPTRLRHGQVHKMAVYSQIEREALWAAVNPGNGNPHLMGAISMAEDAGDSATVNSIGACGLWQIYPYQAGCTNPRTNARMAGEKLRSQGLSAWETYTNGAYKKYYSGAGSNLGTTENVGILNFLAPGLGGQLEKGLKGEGEVNPETTGEALSKSGGSNIPNIAGLGGLKGLEKLINLLTTKNGWVRIGKVSIGLLLLLIGLFGMANITPPAAAVGASKTIGHKGLTVAGGLLGGRKEEPKKEKKGKLSNERRVPKLYPIEA
jgi:hypothetical protein